MRSIPVEAPRMGEMVDYLLAPHGPLPQRDLFRMENGGALAVGGLRFVTVFARNSSHLRGTARLAAEGADIAYVTGHDLPRRGLTETHSIANELVGAPTRLILDLDDKNQTGLDSAAHAAKAMAAIHEKPKSAATELPHASIEQVVAITHPPQLRRFRGFLRFAMDQNNLQEVPLGGHRSSYPLNPLENPFDAFEVVSEICGVDEYGHAANPKLTDDELPDEEMVTYATDLKVKFQEVFDEEGIRNPSTADDTDRSEDPKKMMLLATPGITGAPGGLAVIRNAVHIVSARHGLGRAKRSK